MDFLSGILLLGHDVEDDGSQQNEALDDLLPVDVNTEDGHAHVDNAHQQSTDDNTGHGADAAVSGGAADEAGADGVQLVAVTSLRGSSGETGDDEPLPPSGGGGTPVDDPDGD